MSILKSLPKSFIEGGFLPSHSRRQIQILLTNTNQIMVMHLLRTYSSTSQ